MKKQTIMIIDTMRRTMISRQVISLPIVFPQSAQLTRGPPAFRSVLSVAYYELQEDQADRDKCCTDPVNPLVHGLYHVGGDENVCCNGYAAG